MTVLDWILVIFMGIGATWIAKLGGDLLGRHLVELEDKQKVESERFEKVMNGYHANMLKSWRSSKEQEAVNVRKGVRYGVPNVRERSQRTNGTMNVPMNVQPNGIDPNVQPNASDANSGTNEQDIFGIIQREFERSGTVPGVSDIARSLAVLRVGDINQFERFKSTASDYRKRWIEKETQNKIGV